MREGQAQLGPDDGCVSNDERMADVDIRDDGGSVLAGLSHCTKLATGGGRGMRLAVVGDINCADDQGFAPTLTRAVLETLASADVRLGNLEGAFFSEPAELPYKPGWLNCRPEAVHYLTDAGFDAVACANNVHFGL